MIELTNVTKNYGAFTAVDDASFSVDNGEIIGLVGPNGAGKSTTMKMITGFIVPTSGHLTVAGGDVVMDPTAAQARIGYLPESNPVYPEMTVQDYLVFMARMRGLKGLALQERLAYSARACGLGDRLVSTIKTLSKGYRQRVGIAQAMIHDPDILILDEPTSGLDPNQIVEIRDLIRELGRNKTVILSTHILSEVEETCSRAIMIVGGRIAVDDQIDRLAGSRSIRFACTDAAADVDDKLGGLDSIASVSRLPVRNGVTAWRLEPRDEGAATGDVFRLAVAEGWKVTEIANERRSLEDVFREASSTGAGDAS